MAQLAGYLDRLGLDRGTLILFDMRREAPPLPDRCKASETDYEGRRITTLRL